MKVVNKIKTHILSAVIFFPENHIIYEIISENMVEPKWPKMTSQHDACALHAG